MTTKCLYMFNPNTALMLKFMLSDLFIFLFFYFFFGFHLSDQIHNTLNELSDMINLFPMWSSLIHNQMKVFFRL